MTREERIKAVDREFKELASFAADAWSNIAIVQRLEALHKQVRELYAPIPLHGPPAPAKLPRKRPVRKSRVRELQTYEPVRVTASTRWG